MTSPGRTPQTCTASLRLLPQYFPSPPHRRVAGGHAGVDRAVPDQGAKLGDGHPVPEGGAEVQLELIFAVESSHHGERHQRARLPRERRIAPDFAPCQARYEVLPECAERAGGGERTLDVLGSEHGYAVCEAGLERCAAGAL